MKKTILTIMLAMAAMQSLQAQTITGNWITHIIDEEAEEMVSHILVLKLVLKDPEGESMTFIRPE